MNLKNQVLVIILLTFTVFLSFGVIAKPAFAQPAPPPKDILSGIGEIVKCNPINNEGCKDGITFTRKTDTKFNTLSDFISGLFDIVFIIAFFLAFFWMVWGAFQYIFASGNKEGLAKARSRIIWAIVGFIILALVFAISQFIEQILIPKTPSPLFSLITPAYAQDPIPTPITKDIGKIYDFGDILTLGQGVNRIMVTIFSIATITVIIYFLIGAFTYLTSGGDKEGVGKARSMITHAIIGFVLLMFIFLILQFIPEFFGFNISIFE